jgi:hypothetical protein
MMPVSLHIQYCDDIIRHADDFRYSLIGIYPGVCPLPSRDFVLAQLNLCLTFEIPTSRKDLDFAPLRLEILRDTDVLSVFEMPSVGNAPAVSENPEVFSGLVHHSLDHLPVSVGDKIWARLVVGDVVANGNSLKFIAM